MLSFLFYTMHNNLKNQKLIFFSLLLLALFTYPLISLANRSQVIAGIPVLFLYVFFVWVIAIFILYRMADSKSKKTDEL